MQRYAEDEKGQAIAIQCPLPCGNPIPHITISVANGVTPVYSNELLSKNKQPCKSLSLNGIVDTFPRS